MSEPTAGQVFQVIWALRRGERVWMADAHDMGAWFGLLCRLHPDLPGGLECNYERQEQGEPRSFIASLPSSPALPRPEVIY